MSALDDHHQGNMLNYHHHRDNLDSPKDFGDCMQISSPRKSTLNGGAVVSREDAFSHQSGLNSGRATTDKNAQSPPDGSARRLPGIFRAGTHVQDTNSKIVGSVYCTERSLSPLSPQSAIKAGERSLIFDETVNIKIMQVTSEAIQVD